MKLSSKWKIKLQRIINKINIDEDTLFFALTLVVGVSSAALAVGIFKAIDWITAHFNILEQPSLRSVLAGGALIFISGWITTRLAPSASGSGIPQTKIALVAHHGKIAFREWLGK